MLKYDVIYFADGIQQCTFLNEDARIAHLTSESFH